MLVSIGRKPRDPADTGDKRDLVDRLLECHDRIRTFVALAKAAGERTELPNEERSDACARVTRYFTEALPLHVADEEESIWPRLQGRDANLDRALREMHEQHVQHQPQLHRLLVASARVQRQPDDTAGCAALARAAAALSVEFTEHLTLEETQIFPALRRELSPELQAEIIAELQQRRA